jgi:serine/threonine protein kinase/tetratricopeptide (TPR) repeat protein
MPSNRWTLIEELLNGALDLRPSQRGPWLERECIGDPSLRAEVEKLLACESPSDDFLETRAVAIKAMRIAEAEAPRDGFVLGQNIGAYRIEREIGRGGMGTVYLARRSDDQYRKYVAIKVVQRGMDSDDIIRRFRNERQILAALDHPNIARLLDGGTTPDGLPYLVMEHVEGTPINTYCDKDHLTIEERLQIFRVVCAAVQHAHQNLVVHRDLKPSNILITSDGTPKLLDFGIAKVLNPALSALSMDRTRTELRVLTPDYASPEQVRGENLTTTSDIYSLGVVLYELLTGHRPYRVLGAAPHELARVICEQEPPKPSAVVKSTEVVRQGNSESKTTVSPDMVGRNRATQPDKLRRRLSGDLDNIILMALRKEPRRRYESAAQFSADIQRHVDGLPVVARKDTFNYRAIKFIQRNRVGVAAAVLVTICLLGGIIATAWQARIATKAAQTAAAERDRARREATKAARISAFLQNILGFSDPSWLSPNPKRNRDATIADALEEAGRRAENELADQPEVLAALQFTIGFTYRAQSRFDRAEPLLRSSLELRRRVMGPDHQDTAQSMVGLAECRHLQGSYEEAESLYRRALAIYRREQASGTVDTRWFDINLNDLGLLLNTRGDPKAAEPLLREAIEISSKNFTGADRATLGIMNSNLASILRDQGDLDGAIHYYQQSLTEFRRLSGEPRYEMATAMGYLAGVMSLKGDYAASEALAREAYDVYVRTVGEVHQYTPYSLIALADNDFRRGDYRKAREEIDHAISIQERALPIGHIDFARSWVVLGKILTVSNTPASGESYLRRAVEVRTKSLLPGHPATAEAIGALGANLISQNRFDEAEPLLVQSYESLKARMGPRDPRAVEAAQRLARLYEAWHKPEQAATFRAVS